jgi:polyphosphate kinase 2 (PPK2 family)
LTSRCASRTTRRDDAALSMLAMVREDAGANRGDSHMPKDEAARAPRLADADLNARIRNADYTRRLAKLQRKLTLIQEAYLFSGLSGVIVFEGWDAAGKGGTIRRISAALDPRSFKVWPIGPPRKYYLERHYFLRFMERLPPAGAIAAFDRSWYGRVLVERVEQLTPVERWKAAYREIADFERMITDDGTRIVKLFFHISPEEQLKRFEARLNDPLKRWKLSYEDFRNRKRWDAYSEAIDEMFARTSTPHAPWHLVPANDKQHARITAMTEITRRLGDGVDLAPPKLDDTVLAEARAHFDLNPLQMARFSRRTE